MRRTGASSLSVTPGSTARPAEVHLERPIVGMAGTPDGHGYWLVASDGGIFTFGDAGFYGSTGGGPPERPIVGMAGTPDGRGYWLVASDGGIFSFGDAGLLRLDRQSVHLARPIVGMAGTPDGQRLLVGRVGRGHLHLRRRRVLRIDRRRSIWHDRSWAWPVLLTGAVTGWLRRTGASSPSERMSRVPWNLGGGPVSVQAATCSLFGVTC